MSKRCPYCNEEMELGYIQCRDGVFWDKKKRIIAALPPLSASSLSLAPSSALLKCTVVEAYNCHKCKKIVIDYNEEDSL